MHSYPSAADRSDSPAEKKTAVIDSHVHFWKYNRKRDSWITDDMKLLQQNYLPEQLTQSLIRNGVDGVVAVQADQSEEESAFLAELAATHPIIHGVVGWIDLLSDKLEDRLRYFSRYPVIRGWRHVVQGEPDDFLLQADFQRGVRALKEFGYTYDLLIYPRQLRAAIEFVSRCPDQSIVLDHCAKPIIRNKEISEWKELLRELASFPQIHCKLSGLFTEAKWSAWSPGDFYPYLDAVFESFGTGRLMFGSDWPVMLLSGIYVQWKSLLEKYMEGFRRKERDAVFGGNAIRFYQLSAD
jgi:L-fuconolactonase